MSMLSYNEENNRRTMVRHIFWPSLYGLVSEAIIGVMALVIFNFSSLSDQLLSKNLGTTDPLAVWSQLLDRALSAAQSQHIVQQTLLFGFWAIIGALIYILVFRLAQIFFGVERSVTTGVLLVRQDHAGGALRWLASLHDLFVKIIIAVVGGAALAVGALVCFGIASQELEKGLNGEFPANLRSLFLSLLGAVLSVRFVVLGLSLLSRRFRNWYTA